MDIVIPTYGRALPHMQTTLRQMNEDGIVPKVVVQLRERELWWGHNAMPTLDYELHVLPDEIRTIAPTRQWIIDHVGESDKVVMVDDDLVFYRRRDDDRTKLRDLKPGELKQMLLEIEAFLMNHSHVGIASREGANRNTEEYSHNTRIMRVLGYRRDTLQKLLIAFGRLPVMEDFDVALRLLRHGLPNIVLNNWANNQAGSGKEGGCSHFRTPDLHAESARRLAALHPGYVKTVEKTTKGAWGGGTRTDVHVQWKKAFKDGSAA